MAKEKAHILILGDELGMGEAMQEAFERAGHEVDHVLLPDLAFPILTQKRVDYIFADCMLQGQMNGVDFFVHIREHFKNIQAKFVLMSGIFTDKSFIKESVDRSGAVAFLEKKSGFDMNQAVKLIKMDEVKSVVPPARKLLYQMFAKEKVSSREKRKVIESLEEVSGFDLPFIYSLLVETGSSGYLNIYERNGGVSGISFSKGCIVGVDTEDKTTFLGEMLIQSGYVMTEDVKDALNEKTNRKLGLRLIKAARLSPHALDLVITEQMNIRLSRTISDQTIKINFAATDVDLLTPHIDSEELQFFLHDWIASKVTAPWLKSLYMVLSSNPLNLSPSFRDDHPALEMGLVKALPGLVDRLRKGTTLNALLAEKGYSEVAIYKGIHFLLTKGLVLFGAKAAFKSEEEQLLALKKIANDIQGKSGPEITEMLGAENLQAGALDNLLGPCPADVKGAAGTLWRTLHQKLQESSQVAVTTQSREKNRQDAADREAEAKLRAAQQVEEARKALGFNQYAKALAILLEVQKITPTIDHLHILLAWAKLGTIDASKKASQLKEIEFELMQVPAEERYDAHYPFVLGLFHRTRGDLMGARKHIERALNLNSSLMAARREMSALEEQLKKEKDIFSAVGGLFKRR